MAFISNGTTILDNGAFSVGLGSLVLISEQTASSSANISFTSGIDSTYPIYRFEFINIHAQNDITDFTFNFSTDSGSNYNVTKTTTWFNAYHNEADTGYSLAYDGTFDIAQGTGFAIFETGQGNDNDQSMSGYFYLFNPSSTTYVKHFIAQSNSYLFHNYTRTAILGGYGNTTSAIDGIQFKMASGNIDSGTIKLYGIKDS